MKPEEYLPLLVCDSEMRRAERNFLRVEKDKNKIKTNVESTLEEEEEAEARYWERYILQDDLEKWKAGRVGCFCREHCEARLRITEKGRKWTRRTVET
jgi:hypothetical protein